MRKCGPRIYRIYRWKEFDESYPKMYFLLNLSHCVKSYGHLCQMYQNHSPKIWSCHVILSSNSENFYFSPNSVLNFRKVTKFCENGLKNKKVTSKKQSGGGVENTLPTSVFIGLNNYMVKKTLCHNPLTYV